MAKQQSDDPSEVVYPIGVHVGVGVESTHIDGVEYLVDPETGNITGPLG